MRVTLSWSAAGQQYDQGISTSYVICYGSSMTQLISDTISNGKTCANPYKIQMSWASPKVAATLVLPNEGLYYFRVQAVNDLKSPGQWSNIVPAGLKAELFI